MWLQWDIYSQKYQLDQIKKMADLLKDAPFKMSYHAGGAEDYGLKMAIART